VAIVLAALEPPAQAAGGDALVEPLLAAELAVPNVEVADVWRSGGCSRGGRRALSSPPAEMNEHRQLLMPGDDRAWGDLGNAFPDWPASDQDAILKPPKPEIIPAARILQLAAEHDTQPDHEAAD
jgi:hypothetical protein